MTSSFVVLVSYNFVYTENRFFKCLSYGQAAQSILNYNKEKRIKIGKF